MSHTLMLEDSSSGAVETVEALRQESGMLPILFRVCEGGRRSVGQNQNTARCAEPSRSVASKAAAVELSWDWMDN